VGVTVALLTVLAISFVTFSPERDRPEPLPPPASTVPPRPLLVGLGDSVAAGFGAGGARVAYPGRVAARLGYTVQNLADPGATADGVLDDQLPSIERTPAVVTLTVGANDIRFGECFAALFGLGEDPCAGRAYDDALERLRDDLGDLLDALRAEYPDAGVYVSRYYDPLPARAGDLCGLDDARFSGGGVGDRFVRRTARRLFDQRLRNWERDVYARTTTRLARLNAVIDDVTIEHGATLVRVDFRGHDLCSAQPWVFAPDIAARLNFRWPGPDYAERVTHRAGARCRAPCGPNVRFRARYDANLGTLVVDGELHPNGTPHPTVAGQRAIATAFTAVISP
jgi:hypothetical protein